MFMLSKATLENAVGMILIYDENNYSKFDYILINDEDMNILHDYSEDGYYLLYGNSIKSILEGYHIEFDFNGYTSPLGLQIQFKNSKYYQNDRDGEYFGYFIAEGCEHESIDEFAKKFINTYIFYSFLTRVYREYVTDVYTNQCKLFNLKSIQHYHVSKTFFDYSVKGSDVTIESVTKQLEYTKKRAEYLRSLIYSDTNEVSSN